jgi:subtilisin family serine protease
MKSLQKAALIGLLGVLVVSGAFMPRHSLKPEQSRNLFPTPESTQSNDGKLAQKPDTLEDDKGSQAGTISNSKSSSNNDDEQGKTLVRFASQEAQVRFVQENSLSELDLDVVEQLGVYAVRRSEIKTTAGVEVFTTKRYKAALTPIDTHYGLQWHLGKVGAPAAWNNTISNAAPVVAVIDTGFGLTHEDLDSKWATNAGESGAASQEGSAPNCTSRALAVNKSCNNLDDDDDGYIDNHTGWDFVTDTNSVQAGEVNPLGSGVSHGTLVSGLIAAETNNGQGMSGVSWGSQILPIQALSDDGDGDTLSVALAINYAVRQGVKVINMSLSSDGDDPLVAEQVQLAIGGGVSVVAAAGNDGVGTLGYPANYPGVIAVGASDSSDVRASFSNYGANLALVAPGTGAICTTGWTQTRPSDYYVCGYSGTSFSSPIVAGAAALLLSQNASLTPAQVKSAITSTATKVAGMSGQSFTNQYGFGRLDLYAALTSVSLPTPRGGCTSHLASAQCEVRAVNSSTNQVVSFGEVGLSTASTLYQSSIPTGLSPGSWLVQTRVKVDGRYSLVREEPLVVSP